MAKYIIAYDLGTGGCKAALYDLEGSCRAEAFISYDTFYPQAGWHEQRPEDWWQAVVNSTRALLTCSGINPHEVAGLGISGQSLGVVPLDGQGRLLRQRTPIWSDGRAGEQAQQFFSQVAEADWYRTTGNGFPAPLYTVFKVMWYRQHEPEMFKQTARILGSKDYINYRLTGRMATDFSYASGSGVYDLRAWGYSDRLVKASGLPQALFPEILPSTEIIGQVSREAAKELGLPAGAAVCAGGVDNSCMALGARNIQPGRVYNSLGSSSWIAVTSAEPLVNERIRPFIFAHVMPKLFNSATSLFSAGSSFRWVRDNLCRDLLSEAQFSGVNVYDLMTAEAARAMPGCGGLLFNPSLAGGSSMDASPNIRGAFIGLDLSHTRAELIRAAMEGVALELRLALDALRKLAPVSGEMLVVGGGSRSKLWRQIYADVYNLRIVKTNIDQQAAALGATALAAVGLGLWPDFSIIDRIHQVEDVTDPIPGNNAVYERLLPLFRQAGDYLADIGDQARQ